MRIRTFISLGATMVSAFNPVASHTEDRGFTVEDSIELTAFEFELRTPEGITFSPDRKHFALVTVRGLMASNQTESDLWTFDTRQVADFVLANDAVKLPLRKRVARLIGVPKSGVTGPYASLITSVKWSADSTSLYFLGENAQGNRQIYRASLTSETAQPLTGAPDDVNEFSESAGALAYFKVKVAPAGPVGEPVNSTASWVGGLSLQEILWPDRIPWYQPMELGTIRHGKSTTVMNPISAESLKLSRHNDMAPAISPNGHAVVVPLPAIAITSDWEVYGDTNFPFKARTADASALSGSGPGFWPWQYAVVDLDHGVIDRIETPSGVVASPDRTGAAWSPDGNSVLLLNTYLPLQGVARAERAQRLHPCAAAVVRFPGHEMSCVAYSRSERMEQDQNKKLMVYAAQFSPTADDVVLRLSWSNTRVTEHYQYQTGQWRRTASVNDLADAANAHQVAGDGSTGTAASSASPLPLQLAIKQDLNTRPALWAADPASGKARQIWDPNPQLNGVRMGEVSIYRWKDATGYEWSAALIKPVGYIPGKRYPLIVETHGFHDNHEFIFAGPFTTAFAGRAFSSAGFMVLDTKDRHDHENTSEEAPNMVRGFESAIDQLNADGLVDPNNVGIIGFSRTCYYAESALIHAPQRYAAATLADGTDESYMSELLFGVGVDWHEGELIYGAKPFGAGLKAWVSAAPGFQLDRIQTPVMIQAVDPSSIPEEWEIYASLSWQKKPVELLYIPEGRHVLQLPLERLASQQGDVDWFRFWMQGYEDTAAAKARQYRRWEKLCDMQPTANPGRPTLCVGTKH
jgi:dipeptidyl aminopeptidase/acylaminoacyl peptidase